MTFCALNYGIGRCRARTVHRTFRGLNFGAMSSGRSFSVVVVGSYAMARVDSHGAHRTIRHFGGRDPGTIVILANYVIRTFDSSTGVLASTSVVVNGASVAGAIGTMASFLRGHGPFFRILPRREGRTFGAPSVRDFTRHAHTCVGVRSNYSHFYACYVVPATHK